MSHVLSPHVIDQVDAHASAWAQEHWDPRTPEGDERRYHLGVLSLDLNLLYAPGRASDVPALPGREDAMYAVVSDLALRASAIMRAVPKSELSGMAASDPSIALDPIRFDSSESEKIEERRVRLEEREAGLAFHGSPPPSFHDRGPLPPDAAMRVERAVDRVLKAGVWKLGRSGTAERVRRETAHGRLELDADRMERISRNVPPQGDRALLDAYALLHADHALSAASAVARAISVGALDWRSVSSEDARLLRDPHREGPARGLLSQAVETAVPGVDATVASKGAPQAAPVVVVDRGAGR